MSRKNITAEKTKAINKSNYHMRKYSKKVSASISKYY